MARRRTKRDFEDCRRDALRTLARMPIETVASIRRSFGWTEFEIERGAQELQDFRDGNLPIVFRGPRDTSRKRQP